MLGGSSLKRHVWNAAVLNVSDVQKKKSDKSATQTGSPALLFMPTLLILEMAARCRRKLPESHWHHVLRRQTRWQDRPIKSQQRAGNTFPLAEDYANKLLPTGPCGMPPSPDPSLPRTAVGTASRIGRLMTATDVGERLGTFATRQTRKRQCCCCWFFFWCFFVFIFVSCPKGDSFHCQVFRRVALLVGTVFLSLEVWPDGCVCVCVCVWRDNLLEGILFKKNAQWMLFWKAKLDDF